MHFDDLDTSVQQDAIIAAGLENASDEHAYDYLLDDDYLTENHPELHKAISDGAELSIITANRMVFDLPPLAHFKPKGPIAPYVKPLLEFQNDLAREFCLLKMTPDIYRYEYNEDGTISR